ncbi:MAG: histidine-type phosphatase [Ferruginibacter sp.]
MKKIILAICIGFFISLPGKGQNCNASFLGSKTLYQPQQEQYKAPPAGYLPVFINHVGRHGARHLTKDVSSSYAWQVLAKADSSDGLSAAGRLLKEKILLLEKIEKPNFKSISLRGKAEQEGIANRMFGNYVNIFSHAKTVLHIDYTKEIRTLQTSDAFLAELKRSINEAMIVKKLNDTTLRFYDMSPAYDAYKENGDWIIYLQQLKTSVKYNDLASTVSRQFFTPAYFKHLTARDQVKLATDLYGFVTIFYSIQQEIRDAGYKLSAVDMQSFLTCAQLATLKKIDNAEDFYQKGPGTNEGGIQVKIALPLLADFINTTDEFIKTKAVSAQLRFGHAETISPYAALLGLAPAPDASKKTGDIGYKWNADKVIPLSANIQWIIYQKKGSEAYLVKFLLNEKEVAVKDLNAEIFPYYKWTDVRTFYIKKLQRYNAELHTDFVQFLKDVK